MKYCIPMLFCGLFFIGSSTASAHFDIVAYADNGRIAIGGHDDVLNINVTRLSVFGLDFDEDPLDPFVIGDPGFNNGAGFGGFFPNNGLLPTNATLSMDIATGLLYWNGAGAPKFGPASPGVQLGLKRGNVEVRISANSQVGTPPTIGATGRLHVHLESLLYQDGDAGLSLPDAPAGIYVVGLTLGLIPTHLDNYDLFYLVYNHQLDEATHDTAIDFVATRLVPEPSAWIVAILAICGFAVLQHQLRRGSGGVNKPTAERTRQAPA